MGRPRKFETPEGLEAAWEWYKADCNNMTVLTHEFSAKNSEFVSRELKRSVTYTIEGFCLFADISRRCFYEYYDGDEVYGDTVTRIREECEVDAREKFELGVLPTQLAGLWMSNYKYSTKTDNNMTVTAPVVFHDDLENRHHHLLTGQ